MSLTTDEQETCRRIIATGTNGDGGMTDVASLACVMLTSHSHPIEAPEVAPAPDPWPADVTPEGGGW